MDIPRSVARLSDGIELTYLDSGAPASESYTTLVCVHGHTYTAHNFSKIISEAASRNLRVIAVNRRDYAGSTLFSETELEVIRSKNDETHTKFLRERGLELAQFLAYLVNEKGVKQVDENGQGGLSFLGWSLGNIICLAFLRHIKSYPIELLETLEPYLKHYFIYEGGVDALGYPAPEGSYHPLRDPSIHVRMRGIEFGVWVSSFYKHPVYASNVPVGERRLDGLMVRAPNGPEIFKRSTFDNLSRTPKELLSCVDTVAGERSEQPFWDTVNRDLLYDLTQGALLLNSDSEGTVAFPRLCVSVIYGRASMWSVQWASWKLEQDVERWDENGQAHRPVTFHATDEGNHFFHWEEPQRFLDSITKVLQGTVV